MTVVLDGWELVAVAVLGTVGAGVVVNGGLVLLLAAARRVWRRRV